MLKPKISQTFSTLALSVVLISGLIYLQFFKKQDGYETNSINANLKTVSTISQNILELSVIVPNKLPIELLSKHQSAKPKIQPEPIKVSDQKLAPVILSIKTDKPIIFLGIDDGEVTNPEFLKFFEDRKWSFTLFPNKTHYDKNPEFFKSLLATGAVLGNHTMNHPNLNKLSYADQKKEICASQEAYQKDFGIKPKLFRPPFGNYNKNTQQAVKDCGMVAIVNWKARVDEDKMWYQVGDKLNKGEIVLMHFLPNMMQDLKAFEDEISKQGLVVGNLDEWIE